MPISFTSSPLSTLGSIYPEKLRNPVEWISWITQSLVPWINKRSGLVLLASTEVTSNVASVEFTEGINSDFPAYLVVCSDVTVATDNVEFQVRFSEDSGTTWEDDAGDYRHSRFGNVDGGAVAAAGSAADTEITLISGLGNASGEAFSYFGILQNPSSASFKKLGGIIYYGTTAAAFGILTSGGHYDGSTNPINGIQFFASSGDLTGGSIQIYGLRK